MFFKEVEIFILNVFCGYEDLTNLHTCYVSLQKTYSQVVQITWEIDRSKPVELVEAVRFQGFCVISWPSKINQPLKSSEPSVWSLGICHLESRSKQVPRCETHLSFRMTLNLNVNFMMYKLSDHILTWTNIYKKL